MRWGGSRVSMVGESRNSKPASRMHVATISAAARSVSAKYASVSLVPNSSINTASNGADSDTSPEAEQAVAKMVYTSNQRSTRMNLIGSEGSGVPCGSGGAFVTRLAAARWLPVERCGQPHLSGMQHIDVGR